MSSTVPILVFGFDAGDPALMLQWANDGTLPALCSLLKRGCHTRFSGPEMASEHGMWVTLTSGISRARHGYYYFRQLIPGSYELLPARGRWLECRPFWKQLPDHRIAIIDVPDIASPEPAWGIQVSEWATHYPCFSPSTEPATLLPEIIRDFGRRQFIDEEPEAPERTDWRIFNALMARIKKKKQLCLKHLAAGRFDLVFVVFGECHTGAHQFWKYHKAAAGRLAHAVRDIYRAIDDVLGAILDLLPQEANVFVVSSVGMKEQWPAAGLNEEFCLRLGYQVPAASTPVSSARPIDILRRLLPQGVRNQLSKMIPQEKQDRLISDKFRTSTDWSRTSLFCIPSYYTGQFRVNLRGREPCGIVSPGREYKELLDRAESDLRALINPVSGKPAIRAVMRTVDLFGGESPASLPDLFAEWRDSAHFMEEVQHPTAVLQQTRCEFHRSTDHSQLGFLAAAGPGITARGKLHDVSPLDLAPTLLTHLSSLSYDQLDGKPIPGMATLTSLGPD
jgi:predicted AlkP superfamily phosphohydrolase/phosphomutase